MNDRDPLIEPACLTAALAYARLGWQVIPIHAVLRTRGRRDPLHVRKARLRSPGKHPRNPSGSRGGSRDESEIRDWWRRWPNANVGIVTGVDGGLVVLDVDADKGGVRDAGRTGRGVRGDAGDARGGHGRRRPALLALSRPPTGRSKTARRRSGPASTPGGKVATSSRRRPFTPAAGGTRRARGVVRRASNPATSRRGWPPNYQPPNPSRSSPLPIVRCPRPVRGTIDAPRTTRGGTGWVRRWRPSGWATEIRPGSGSRSNSGTPGRRGGRPRQSCGTSPRGARRAKSGITPRRPSGRSPRRTGVPPANRRSRARSVLMRFVIQGIPEVIPIPKNAPARLRMKLARSIRAWPRPRRRSRTRRRSSGSFTAGCSTGGFTTCRCRGRS